MHCTPWPGKTKQGAKKQEACILVFLWWVAPCGIRALHHLVVVQGLLLVLLLGVGGHRGGGGGGGGLVRGGGRGILHRPWVIHTHTHRRTRGGVGVMFQGLGVMFQGPGFHTPHFPHGCTQSLLS